MKSALYVGTVRHRRFAPLDHHFRYRVGLCFLDLAELDTVFRGRWLWSTKRPAWAWLRRADYLGSKELSLDEAVRRRVEEETGERPRGPIRMLTHLRTFGYVFNPVSFYFCFDEQEHLQTVVAEITNTPWKERHAYVLSRDQAIESSGDRLRFRFPKTFHVSPFFDMDHEYDWRFHLSERAASVHMENWASGERVFDATMTLERRAITGPSLAGVLIRFPLMSLRVSAAIYWQAFRLWRKRCPFFVHPSKRPQEDLQTIGPVSKGT
ncbi:MAG: DUF1365 domain-containing protein [Planctomycetota bacterium]